MLTSQFWRMKSTPTSQLDDGLLPEALVEQVGGRQRSSWKMCGHWRPGAPGRPADTEIFGSSTCLGLAFVPSFWGS